MQLGRFCRVLLSGAALAAAAAAALWCLSCGPNDKYEIVMEPDDGSLDRQLTAWREDGSRKNGEPNEIQMSPEVLQALAGKYPRRATTQPDAARQTFAGKFVGKLPGELGGAGEYRIIHTLMGSAAGYVERFAGTDDLTHQLEQINLAADTITDVLGGYLASRLDKHPGFEKLRRFMDTDFRKDIKNLSIYLWSAKSGLVSSEENKMEIRARVVLYLIEHDYVHYEHVFAFARQMADPAVKPEDKAKAALLTARRLLARKMGIDETDKQLAFLTDPNEVAKSFEKFVRTSEVSRRAAERWRERSASWPAEDAGPHAASSQPASGPATQPATTQSQPASAPAEPDALEVIKDIAGVLAQNLDIGAFVPLFSGFSSDHVSVKLKLPAEPLISNGQWDNKSRGLAWSFNNRGSPLSHICYAVWASSDAGFQKEHFGRVILDGQELALYCGWQKGLTADESRQWDELLKTVRPATAEAELSGFRAKHRVAAEPESAPASQPATTAPTTMPATAPTTMPATAPTTMPATAPAYQDSYVAYGAGMILDALARPER